MGGFDHRAGSQSRPAPAHRGCLRPESRRSMTAVPNGAMIGAMISPARCGGMRARRVRASRCLASAHRARRVRASRCLRPEFRRSMTVVPSGTATYHRIAAPQAETSGRDNLRGGARGDADGSRGAGRSAGGGTRTLSCPCGQADFKSAAYASSATPAGDVAATCVTASPVPSAHPPAMPGRPRPGRGGRLRLPGGGGTWDQEASAARAARPTPMGPSALGELGRGPAAAVRLRARRQRLPAGRQTASEARRG